MSNYLVTVRRNGNKIIDHVVEGTAPHQFTNLDAVVRQAYKETHHNKANYDHIIVELFGDCEKKEVYRELITDRP